MQVTLLNYTPLNICSHAIRTCWQSFEKGDNGGEKDVELIERVGNKFKHASTLEHLSYNFYIQGISRALLQELARHRIASLSVKSTRYTLKELKKEAKFELGDFERAARFIVLTGDEKPRHSQILSTRVLQNRTHVERKRAQLTKFSLASQLKIGALGDQKSLAKALRVAAAGA